VLQAGATKLTSFCHQHYLLADNFIIDDPDLPAFPETAEQAHARINVALEVEFLYHECWTSQMFMHSPSMCCRQLATSMRERTFLSLLMERCVTVITFGVLHCLTHDKLKRSYASYMFDVQAVNRSVVRLMPWTTVIDAQHCCYTVAHRKQDEDGDWGQWELDVNQLHKVQVLGL